MKTCLCLAPLALLALAACDPGCEPSSDSAMVTLDQSPQAVWDKISAYCPRNPKLTSEGLPTCVFISPSGAKEYTVQVLGVDQNGYVLVDTAITDPDGRILVDQKGARVTNGARLMKHEVFSAMFGDMPSSVGKGEVGFCELDRSVV